MSDHLSEIHPHPRDSNIIFKETQFDRRYIVLSEPNIKYKSATILLKDWFSNFNADDAIFKIINGKNWNPDNIYWGMSPEEIKAKWSTEGDYSRTVGVSLHNCIEFFMNLHEDSTDLNHLQLFQIYVDLDYQIVNKAWENFLEFVKSFPDLKPYRTEWRVYDSNLKWSGTIDMVYINPDGSLDLYDWKCCKNLDPNADVYSYGIPECISNIPDTKYYKYSLQLNIYKKILESSYNVRVNSMYLVSLHSSLNNFERIMVPDLQQQITMLAAYEKNKK
jgi:hypothetical protein